MRYRGIYNLSLSLFTLCVTAAINPTSLYVHLTRGIPETICSSGGYRSLQLSGGIGTNSALNVAHAFAPMKNYDKTVH